MYVCIMYNAGSIISILFTIICLPSPSCLVIKMLDGSFLNTTLWKLNSWCFLVAIASKPPPVLLFGMPSRERRYLITTNTTMTDTTKTAAMTPITIPATLLERVITVPSSVMVGDDCNSKVYQRRS